LSVHETIPPNFGFEPPKLPNVSSARIHTSSNEDHHLPTYVQNQVISSKHDNHQMIGYTATDY
jgi:hypothetical protein